jgi:hypothetical protein
MVSIKRHEIKRRIVTGKNALKPWGSLRHSENVETLVPSA